MLGFVEKMQSEVIGREEKLHRREMTAKELRCRPCYLEQHSPALLEERWHNMM